MRRQFLPSGRVKYFPMCNYHGDKQFTSLVSGDRHGITVRKKVVDATYSRTAVPLTQPPRYTVAPEARCVPLNALPSITAPHSGYIVIGSGKTGIDACLWLLTNNVTPENIRWIMPRDAWLQDRANLQFRGAFFDRSMESFAAQLEAVGEADSIEDVFTKLELSGQLLRIDPTITPISYHCGTISKSELEQLRRIRNVVRLGRVRHIDKNETILEQGVIATDPNCLHIDCSAGGIPARPSRPIFGADSITLQWVRTCQPTFSAAFIGHLEANYHDDNYKNELCTPIPPPDQNTDWLRMWAINLSNHYLWSKNAELNKWISKSRLDGFAAMVRNVGDTDITKKALVQRYRKSVRPAVTKLERFMAIIDTPKSG